MATELTSPVTRAPLTHQAVTRFSIEVPHKRSMDGTSAVINRDKVEIRYEVTSWDSDGNVLARASRTVPFSSWPPAFKLAVRDVYDLITTDAKNNGLIAPGTDEQI